MHGMHFVIKGGVARVMILPKCPLGISYQCFILPNEKFLQFDWLRAVVFQLNLKYLHVKITVSMVTKITKQIKKTMAERFPDFQLEEIQELTENSEKQNTKKSTSTWLNVWTSCMVNFETILKYHSWYLCQISLQIILLPMLIKLFLPILR